MKENYIFGQFLKKYKKRKKNPNNCQIIVDENLNRKNSIKALPLKLSLKSSQNIDKNLNKN